ncbi:MAG: hypothetical protein HRU15_16295 [Planctomycetes bacterium]|nr:hypothetical protein [Planctomycetota bacterium]
MTSFQEYIHASAIKKEVLDIYLDEGEASWARYHPQLGYTLGNYMPRDGIDGSLTISTAQKDRSRSSVIYGDRPCRINTYGDSFTQCHQVSDHETWQEYLAGHLGEPIRNLGMGSYGVYQSYKRMLLTEKTDLAADNIMLYIWGDDHYRSVVRSRYAQIHNWFGSGGLSDPRMFHGNFWSNIEMDMNSGIFKEHEARIHNKADVYNMCDADFMWQQLHDDLMMQMCVFTMGWTDDYDYDALNALAETLGHDQIPQASDEKSKTAIQSLSTSYAMSATCHIIDKIVSYGKDNNKNILINLFDPSVMRELIHGEERYDKQVADYLINKDIPHFDMNLVHAEDFKAFNLSFEDYKKRYFIGHYSPAGNHFFAYAIKNTVVNWLNPKPLTYQEDDQVALNFEENYLPE